jgi:hypothetical protein
MVSQAALKQPDQIIALTLTESLMTGMAERNTLYRFQNG